MAIKFRNFITVSLLLTTFVAKAQNSNHDCALRLVVKSMDAMGGETLLKTIKSLSITGFGHSNILEQSEKYEGPYMPGVFDFSTVIDNRRKLISVATDDKFWGFKSTYLIDTAIVAALGKRGVAPFRQGGIMQDEMLLSPLKVLFTAKNAMDLQCASDTLLFKEKTKVVIFSCKGFPVKMYFNASTSLLTATEITRPYSDFFLDIWGDVKKFTYYSFWDMNEAKLHYPMQSDIYLNGRHYSSSFIKKFELDKEFIADSLVITSAVKAQSLLMETRMRDNLANMTKKGTKEIAKDIWFVSSSCNSTIVKTAKGIYIIEAGSSNENSVTILEMAKTKFPDEKILGIITTSDAWLHIGGLREYAANNIPIIALQKNKTIVTDLLKAPYSTKPDKWQTQTKKSFAIKEIAGKTVIGEGDNRMELYPYNTEAGDRMMMVYFPSHKLLYASDLYQPKTPAGKYWQLHYIYEVCEAVKREKLEVEKLYAMHSPLLDYNDILKDMKMTK